MTLDWIPACDGFAIVACRGAGMTKLSLPKSNKNYWTPKLTRNVERDRQHAAALRALGWRVLIIWDCETKSAARLTAKIKGFLDQA